MKGDCPKCGTEGYLGTSYAYVQCPACGTCVYWTPDHGHPGMGRANWSRAVKLSPYAQRHPNYATNIREE